uniref:Putative secreted protein n=1 Tax=Ixodes ricinus TaxID=34613 RepID=A0A6B0UHA9_IXORI
MGFPSPLHLQATMILFTLLHQHTTGGRGRSTVVTGAARPAEALPPAMWHWASTSFQQPCRQFSCSYPRCPEQLARGAQGTKSSGFRSSPGPPGKPSRLFNA